MGGDRHNNVVDALYRGLPPAGVIAHRFDFASADLAVAVAQTVDVVTHAASDGLPTFVVGYSFGGGVAALVDERVDGWFLVAPALAIVEPKIGDDPRPKGIAAAAHDQFFPPDRIDQLTLDWINTERVIIPGADHFFSGQTGAVVLEVLAWIGAVRQAGR
jgi:alpha/beta superfamily hydrolase